MLSLPDMEKSAKRLTIAVIEDHDLLRQSIVRALGEEGYAAFGVDCAEVLDDEQGGRDFDIAVLDIKLPGEDGLSLSRRLRAAHPHLGIVILTAKNALYDRVAGYGSGADLYLTKPVAPQELLAAVGALGRRVSAGHAGGPPPSTAVCLTLHRQSRRLTGPAGDHQLSEAETLILTALARSRGHSLETWQLMEINSDKDSTKAALEVRIARLRRKMASVGAVSHPIRAVRGAGYALAADVVVL
jgi:DNA-binding response OmpR family regulator